MSAKRYLLDTSALVSYFENEAGASEVDAIVRSGAAQVPWTALLEVYYISLQERDEEEALLRFASIRAAPEVEVLWNVDEALLLTAGQIKATNRVSFADALIAAYAIQNDAVLVHKAPEFDALGDLIPVERLPYKGRTKG